MEQSLFVGVLFNYLSGQELILNIYHEANGTGDAILCSLCKSSALC